LTPLRARCDSAGAMPTRRTVLRTLGGIVAAGASTTAYATIIEPWLRLTVAKHRPAPPGRPPDLPLSIAVLADLHAGEPLMSLARVEAIVAVANALRPDLMVLLGDYAASHRYVTKPVPMREAARALAALRAPLGVHAIAGNHDWWDDPEAMRRQGAIPPAWSRALEQAGLPVMHNAAQRLTHRGRAFWLLGLSDLWAFRRGSDGHWRGADDLPATLSQVTDDAPALLLAHEPDVFPRVPARVALTLAGHTYGGQVRVFGFSPMVPSDFGNRYAYGHVVEEGRHLIVSGGLGNSIVPVRFGVPPEITLVRLGPA
jgi:predicted MPP superfamily phosphohydrolase